jgi:chromosome segregation ATPase
MKLTSVITLAMFLNFSGMILLSCQSTTEKEEKATEDVQEAKHELADVKKDIKADSIEAIKTEEWRIFRNEADARIRSNDIRIAALKKKIEKPGNKMDAEYPQSILDLEKKNKDLRDRMDAYEKNQSDWESFKREYNHDMEELGEALKDFRVNNKN